MLLYSDPPDHTRVRTLIQPFFTPRALAGLLPRTDLEGNRISLLRAVGRYFAKIISAIILLIGFIMVAFTEKKQGLHDMIAGTLVVKAN